MPPRVLSVAAALVLVPALALAVPRAPAPRLHPGAVSPLPTYVRAVQPAVVALSVTAPAEAPSSARLGARRAGSGVIFDARGYVVTVSYLVLDATRIEARTRDGAAVPARPSEPTSTRDWRSCGWRAPARGRRPRWATRTT
jgi:S1-C subfamily serine protease